MKRYFGTENGPRGVYLNQTTGEFINCGEAGVLPGDNQVKYLKVPAAMAMALGPFTGLAFVLFLPFAGLAGVIGFLGYKAWCGTKALEHKTLTLVTVNRGGGRKIGGKDNWELPNDNGPTGPKT